MLAQTPPMGWNSWNTFGHDISESIIMEITDAMVDRGLRDAGYQYVVIDDCWSKRKRENGRLVADPEKFPHGMKYLSDYIHSKGMKFGIYSCCGVTTCAGYPSSFDHEYVDAQTFADWGVDFLKYDNCNHPQKLHTADEVLYRRMSMALKATGRDILFSACNWGSEDVWSWIRSAGAHMYRSTGDIYDNPASFRDIAQSQIPKLATSAPGCYNDVDMLICGMYNRGNVAVDARCTPGDYYAHFALWCMMASPLMIGCDVRNCDEETIKLLTNPDLIRINQDEEARPPFSVGYNRDPDVFDLFRHLSGGRYAFLHVNLSENERWSDLYYYDLGITTGCGYKLILTDIMTGEKIEPGDEIIHIKTPSHSARMFYADLVKE